MRLIIALTAATLLGLGPALGLAQTAAPAGTPTPNAPTPVPAPSAPPAPTASPVPDTAPPPAGAAAAKPSGKRMTLQERFDAANTAKDGKLTRAEADAAKWGYASRHFDAIDKTHRGYITVDDIRAYSKANHAKRHKSSTTHSTTPATSSGAAPAPATAPSTPQ